MASQGGGFGSFVANVVAQRRKVNNTRKLLGLGERGIVSPQQGPPATAPSLKPAPPQTRQIQPEDEILTSPSPPPSREDMTGRVQGFLDQYVTLREQQALASGRLLPDESSQDWRALQIKRFYKLMAPWKLADSGMEEPMDRGML